MLARRWFVISALACGLAGSMLIYRQKVDARPDERGLSKALPENLPTKRADAGQHVEELRAELAQVHAEVAALRDRVGEPRAPEPVAPAAEPQELDPESLRERREASARRWKDHMAQVAAAFEQEPLDRGFARTAQADVERAIQNSPAIQKVAGKVDCRSRSCRVEIGDGTSGEVKKQVPAFLQSVGRGLSHAQADYVDVNGQKTLVFYLTNDQPAAPSPHR